MATEYAELEWANMPAPWDGQDWEHLYIDPWPIGSGEKEWWMGLRTAGVGRYVTGGLTSGTDPQAFGDGRIWLNYCTDETESPEAPRSDLYGIVMRGNADFTQFYWMGLYAGGRQWSVPRWHESRYHIYKYDGAWSLLAQSESRYVTMPLSFGAEINGGTISMYERKNSTETPFVGSPIVEHTDDDPLSAGRIGLLHKAYNMSSKLQIIKNFTVEEDL